MHFRLLVGLLNYIFFWPTDLVLDSGLMVCHVYFSFQSVYNLLLGNIPSTTLSYCTQGIHLALVKSLILDVHSRSFRIHKRFPLHTHLVHPFISPSAQCYSLVPSQP